MAKPVVDGIERETSGRARVIRIAVTTTVGSEIAQRFGVRGTPTLVLVDGNGKNVQSQVGRLDKASVIAALNNL